MAFLLTCVWLTGCNTVSNTQAPSPTPQTINTASALQPTTQELANDDVFALLLPTTGHLSSSSSAIQNGFMAAYYYQEQQLPNEQSIQIYNTNGKPFNTVYQEAIANGATNIIGPLTKPDVASLNHLDISKPTLALNFSPNGTQNQSLYQFALSPEDEANQVATKAWQDGKTDVLIIAPNSSWGQSIASTFASQWETMGGRVVDELQYSNKTHFEPSIKKILKVNEQSIDALQAKKSPDQPVHRQDINMIFLVASPNKAREIVPLLKYFYANDIPVYATSMIYTGSANPNADKDLDGVKFCDIPLILDNSPQMKAVRKRMQKLIKPSQTDMVRLYAFGIDAYQLSVRENQLQTGNFVMSGMTGTLYLGKQHQVLRELQWAQFVNGIPKKITGIKYT